VGHPVEVAAVRTARERKAFLRLPWAIYGDDPHWVPPLLSAAARQFDPARNPFFEHGEMAPFLARRRGEPVGRIAAIIDRLHNERYGEATGFWGYFESVEDPEVAGALFDAAGEHLRGRGMAAMRGPFNPNINGEIGLLTEGFDSMPFILMPYNPPYYAELVEGAGFTGHMDLFAFHVTARQVSPEQPSIKRFERLAAAIHKRHPGLTVRHIDMSRFDEEVLIFGRLFNAARKENWGFVPATDAEIRAMADDMRAVVDPRLVSSASSAASPSDASWACPTSAPSSRR